MKIKGNKNFDFLPTKKKKNFKNRGKNFFRAGGKLKKK